MCLSSVALHDAQYTHGTCSLNISIFMPVQRTLVDILHFFVVLNVTVTACYCLQGYVTVWKMRLSPIRRMDYSQVILKQKKQPSFSKQIFSKNCYVVLKHIQLLICGQHYNFLPCDIQYLKRNIKQFYVSQLLPWSTGGNLCLPNPTTPSHIICEVLLTVVRAWKINGILPTFLIHTTRRVVVNAPIWHLQDRWKKDLHCIKVQQETKHNYQSGSRKNKFTNHKTCHDCRILKTNIYLFKHCYIAASCFYAVISLKPVGSQNYPPPFPVMEAKMDM